MFASHSQDWWVAYKYPGIITVANPKKDGSIERHTHRFDNVANEKGDAPENGFLEIHAMIWDSKDDGETFYEENIQYKDSFLYQTVSQVPYINQTKNSSVGWVVYNDQPVIPQRTLVD